jgi:hypothetical protein
VNVEILIREFDGSSHVNFIRNFIHNHGHPSIHMSRILHFDYDAYYKAKFAELVAKREEENKIAEAAKKAEEQVAAARKEAIHMSRIFHFDYDVYYTAKLAELRAEKGHLAKREEEKTTAEAAEKPQEQAMGVKRMSKKALRRAKKTLKEQKAMETVTVEEAEGSGEPMKKRTKVGELEVVKASAEAAVVEGQG